MRSGHNHKLLLSQAEGGAGKDILKVKTSAGKREIPVVTGGNRKCLDNFSKLPCPLYYSSLCEKKLCKRNINNIIQNVPCFTPFILNIMHFINYFKG